MRDLRRRADAERVGDRLIEDDLSPNQAIIAPFKGHETADMTEIGRIADDVDRSAGRVAPIQRSLRSTENLDARHVEEDRPEARASRQVNAVDIERHGGLGKS